MKRQVAVIGAGPAGLTAAYQLAKDPATAVTVFEAGDDVGGLARTISLWGQRMDLGPHRFFSSDRRVNALWIEVVGRDYRMVDRLTRIYYKDKFFHYPLRPADALRNLGLVEAARCILSYLGERALPTPQRGDFESWVTGRFGVRLYQIFFKTYSEKLWGINCSELDADFAAQRIKKLSLFEAVKNALCKDHAPRHKTLVDRFAYPLEGTGMVYRRMQSAIEANGGRILLHAPVKGVVTRNGTVAGITLHDDRFHACDEVVSTMPLTLMVQSLPEAPGPVRALAETLRFRNTIIVFLHVRGAGYFSDQWIYVHTNRLRTGRITNFRNWIPELHGDSPNTVLALEYWCNPGDALWSDDDQALLELATREIRATGLLGRSDVLGGHVCRIPRCYPVYDRGYRERLRPVQEYLATVRHLHAIGRYGAFKYNNQDHSILMGLLAAENILQGAGHDLWEINTDYETYQEMALISDTGLVECGQPAGKGA